MRSGPLIVKFTLSKIIVLYRSIDVSLGVPGFNLTAVKGGKRVENNKSTNNIDTVRLIMFLFNFILNVQPPF
jgi:hypothetical protein